MHPANSKLCGTIGTSQDPNTTNAIIQTMESFLPPRLHLKKTNRTLIYQNITKTEATKILDATNPIHTIQHSQPHDGILQINNDQVTDYFLYGDNLYTIHALGQFFCNKWTWLSTIKKLHLDKFFPEPQSLKNQIFQFAVTSSGGVSISKYTRTPITQEIVKEIPAQINLNLIAQPAILPTITQEIVKEIPAQINLNLTAQPAILPRCFVDPDVEVMRQVTEQKITAQPAKSQETPQKTEVTQETPKMGMGSQVTAKPQVTPQNLYEKLLDVYMKNINAFRNKKPVDERFMRSIEEKMNVSEKMVNNFRTTVTPTNQLLISTVQEIFDEFQQLTKLLEDQRPDLSGTWVEVYNGHHLIKFNKIPTGWQVTYPNCSATAQYDHQLQRIGLNACLKLENDQLVYYSDKESSRCHRLNTDFFLGDWTLTTPNSTKQTVNFSLHPTKWDDQITIYLNTYSLASLAGCYHLNNNQLVWNWRNKTDQIHEWTFQNGKLTLTSQFKTKELIGSTLTK